jgi:hypothetical protein
MTLNKFTDKQLNQLKKLDVIIDVKKEYNIDELEEILDTLVGCINGSFIDDDHVNAEGMLCESIIDVITMDKDW